MPSKKESEARAHAESYQVNPEQTGKQMKQELSLEIQDVIRELRKQIKRVDDNKKDMHGNTEVKKCLQEVLDAVSSLQHGDGAVVTQEIRTSKKGSVSMGWIVQEPVEFEDRMKRVKGAIETAKETIRRVQERNESKSLIAALLKRMLMLFAKSSPLDQLVSKLDHLERKLKDNQIDISLRFFLPKPPQPKHPRKEANTQPLSTLNKKPG